MADRKVLTPHESRPSRGHAKAVPYWRALTRRFVTHSYCRRTTVFTKGEHRNHLLFIEKGIVKLTTGHGSSKSVSDIRFSGQFIDPLWQAERRKHIFTAETLVDSRIATVPLSTWKDVDHKDGELIRLLLRLQADEIAISRQAWLDVRSLLASERYVLLLKRFSEEIGARQDSRTSRMILPFEDVEAASFLSISTTHFSKMQKQLCGNGVLRRDGRAVIFESNAPAGTLTDSNQADRSEII